MAFETQRTRLERADKLLEHFLYYASASLLIVLATIVFYTIVMRYVFSAAPLWAEEVPRLLFIWCTYLGVTVATKRGQNIRVTFFIEMLPLDDSEWLTDCPPCDGKGKVPLLNVWRREAEEGTIGKAQGP